MLACLSENILLSLCETPLVLALKLNLALIIFILDMFVVS